MGNIADALAETAMHLNEEAKANRRKPKMAREPDVEINIVTGDDETIRAIDRMEILASETELDVDQLVPTVRDFLVEQFKVRPKPWSACNEGEQRDLYAAAEHAATELVRKIVEAINSSGRNEPVRALLTKFAHGDKIVLTAELKAFSEEETLAGLIMLHKAQGKHVLISAASVDDYRGNLGPSIEPDEPGLDFEGDGDESGDE